MVLLFHLSLNSQNPVQFCGILSLSSAISLLHNSLAKANREDEINQIEDSIVNNFRLDNNFQMICWSGFNMSETSQNFLLRYALL